MKWHALNVSRIARFVDLAQSTVLIAAKNWKADHDPTRACRGAGIKIVTDAAIIVKRNSAIQKMKAMNGKQ